jgi:hypothetical protein
VLEIFYATLLIMFMYEAMQAISNQRDRGEVLHILLDFTGKIFSKSAAFFLPNDYDCGRTECTERLVSLKTINGGLREALVDTIKDNYSVISKEDLTFPVWESHLPFSPLIARAQPALNPGHCYCPL